MISDEELEKLSRHLDQETSAVEDRELEAALADSAELRRIKADLLSIKKSTWLDTPNCPAELEKRISQAVLKKYPARKRAPMGFHLNTLWNPWAGLLATMAIVGFLGLSTLVNRQSPTTEIAMDPDSTLVRAQRDITLAQDQYRIAINNLESIALQRLNEMPLALAQVFSENLRIINQAIVICEQTLVANQINLLAYQSLSQTYQAKIDLLLKVLET